MGVALLVVEHGALLDRVLGDRQVDRDRAVSVRRCGFNSQLQRIEQAAGITAGHIHEVIRRFGADLHAALAVAALRIAQRPLQQLMQMLWLQRLQAEQA